MSLQCSSTKTEQNCLLLLCRLSTTKYLQGTFLSEARQIYALLIASMQIVLNCL